MGFYSNSGEIELEGTSQALKELSEIILSHNHSSVELSLNVPAEVSPLPYDGFLTTLTLVILQGEHKLEIKRDGTKLIISGACSTQSLLANTITRTANDSANLIQKGIHTHIEYFPEHCYLAASSAPLVITVKNES